MRFRLLRLGLPLLVTVCPAMPQAAAPTLPARETLSYNVEWRLITAGKARLFLEQSREGWQVAMQVDSVGLISKFFHVADQYSSVMNPALCTESVQLTAHEGNRQRDTKITFDLPAHKAAYIERDRLKNTVILSHEIDTPPCVHDVPGGLYLLRTLNLEPGQSRMVAVSDGKKAVLAKVEGQAREDVKTPDGLFHTIRSEAYLFNNVLYKRPAHLEIWLSDDRRRLPVQIRVRMPFTIGTITLQLEKHE
ncbi:MAG: DUF3108 domain-containing protein [Bryobacteraceae bacterium]|jgi:hypothetical protein